MHDDSGSDQQGSWQPPEYVSPWIPASSPDEEASGSASRDSSTGARQPEDGSTIPFNNPAYGQGSYPPPPGYPPPGYPPPGYGQYPWGGYGTPPPPRGGFSRTLAYVAVAVLAAAAGAGAVVALNHSNTAASPSSSSPFSNGSESGSSPFGGSENPAAGNGSNDSGGTNSGTGSLNASALASEVDPGLVDVDAQLPYSDEEQEGTGMVLTSTGLVLTNNHVIDQATSVTATLVTTGKTYTAKVLGYDSTDDVALLQLEGASGLKTVTLSDSSKAKVGEAVLALGNACGEGGRPSTAQGTIQALNKSIPASDPGTGTVENLHGMIETNAPIQEGDSGGPIVNGSGQVVGMDTAANSQSCTVYGGYSDQATDGFAIPINTAMSIADEIKAGQASSTVHIGLAGFMGVDVTDPSQGCTTDGGGDGFGYNSGSQAAPVSSGALVCDVYPNSAAAQAGLQSGDVITGVNGTTISSAADLTSLADNSHPGEQFTITYVDQYGTKHTGSATLSAWAK
jgi:S1-C subfamily serine protease